MELQRLVYGKGECFVVYMLHVWVLFCMTCSLLMMVEDTRGDRMGDAYPRPGLITMSVSFCLTHPGAVSDFMFVEVCVRVLRCCGWVCCM